ncbi:hypothetical protein RDI58_007126 [Solanum bulbocastanum]|uniref:Uncharacterized protein n=1 Tax=Solanum bulbocastanum TaxID=147425 RepID=A0AAN8TZS3_SOLBU
MDFGLPSMLIVD